MSTLLFIGWLLLPAVPSLGLLGFLVTARSVAARRAAFVLLMASLVLAAVWVVVVGWWLRDGMGPGSVDSGGWPAVQRFFRDAWIPLAAIVFMGVAGLAVRPRA